jgi:glycosyltransferase involved in cell wall biosynthesis
MVKRSEIALLYQHNDNWIGGSYYIINIVKALLILPDADKPSLRIFYDSSTAVKAIEELNYPYIKFAQFTLNRNIFVRIINRLGKDFFGKLILKQKLGDSVIKNLYPVSEWIDLSNIENYYYWIPDFQERYLKQFFSKKEIWQRIIYQKLLVKEKHPIIFSSNNALNDFDKFYPGNTNKKEVLKFVSIIGDEYLKLNIDALKEKFGINRDFFISPNQFWQHKNQITLIKAAKVLKGRGLDFLIVFTGKEFDHRNPNYVSDLKSFIADNDLQDNFLFLGFIDRSEQLKLMKSSLAIIQPSLFEGWSTVVEDTKALNHVIILSDLALHREQISNNCIFFDPLNEIDLADKIEFSMSNSLVTAVFNNNKDRLEFAKKVVSIFNTVH